MIDFRTMIITMMISVKAEQYMWKSAKSTDPCSAPLWIILIFTLNILTNLRKIMLLDLIFSYIIYQFQACWTQLQVRLFTWSKILFASYGWEVEYLTVQCTPLLLPLSYDYSLSPRWKENCRKVECKEETAYPYIHDFCTK